MIPSQNLTILFFAASVFSSQRVPANFQHFQKHLGSVAERIDARAFAMSPCHRDFHCFELELFRQIQQFRIEAPPFNVLQWENRLGGRAGKGFKTALRILETQAQYHSQQQVENPSEELSVKRLALGLQITLQPA